MTDETLRRSDDLLTELIEIVETARALPMSTSCVLPRERLLDLLDELREVLPPEIEQARAVVASRERLLQEAHDAAAAQSQQAVAKADTVLADADHRAAQTAADAQEQATRTVAAGRAEQADLVAATTVHQAAAQAAAVLRQDADDYHAKVSGEAQRYDAGVRGEADRYAREARTEAQQYATTLTAEADSYAERTLGELAATLHRAAATADQGRETIATRRAAAWLAEAGARSAQSEDAEDARPRRSA